MDYDDVVAASFAARPAGTPLPAAVTAGSAARRLRDACEPIAMHAVWSRHTNARLAECGLDFMGAYVAGRAASLGEPSAAVVAATSAQRWSPRPRMVRPRHDRRCVPRSPVDPTYR